MPALYYVVTLVLGVWMTRRAQYQENLAKATLMFWSGLLGVVVSAWQLFF